MISGKMYHYSLCAIHSERKRVEADPLQGILGYSKIKSFLLLSGGNTALRGGSRLVGWSSGELTCGETAEDPRVGGSAENTALQRRPVEASGRL